MTVKEIEMLTALIDEGGLVITLDTLARICEAKGKQLESSKEEYSIGLTLSRAARIIDKASQQVALLSMR
jgi:hypothetical protein